MRQPFRPQITRAWRAGLISTADANAMLHAMGRPLIGHAGRLCVEHRDDVDPIVRRGCRDCRAAAEVAA